MGLAGNSRFNRMGTWTTSDAGVLCVCAVDDTPKINVLAYGQGYVELKGNVIRVIPHVQNLETCAKHCEMDSSCTHWRRCAGSHLPRQFCLLCFLLSSCLWSTLIA